MPALKDEVVDIKARTDIAVLQSQHVEFLSSLKDIKGSLNNILYAILTGIVIPVALNFIHR